MQTAALRVKSVAVCRKIQEHQVKNRKCATTFILYATEFIYVNIRLTFNREALGIKESVSSFV